MTTNVGSIGMNSGNIPQPPANFIAKLFNNYEITPLYLLLKIKKSKSINL